MSAATRARRARAPPFLDPPGYARHRPEATLLYQRVERHYPAFRELRSEAGRPLPDYIEQEFEAYLKCGRLEEGFLRLRCEDCHAEKLVAFSCKKRGFCPSCGARRMAETAALLADEVLPERPLRQWVLSLPHGLRFLLARNPAALTRVLGVVYRAISGHLLQRAGPTRTVGHTGAVTLIQRFGSALHLNIHFHMLFLDGVYFIDEAGQTVFRRVRQPGPQDLQILVERIAGGEGGPLDDLPGHSITYRIAVGPRAGQKLFTLQTVPARSPQWLDDPNGAARAGGFSLHAGIGIAPKERPKLERLCRYMSRPPVATERLALTSSGHVRYQLKTPYRDGTTHIVIEPLDFMARLAALVPPPRMHLTRYHGVFAPHSKLRAAVTPAHRGMGAPQSLPAADVARPPTPRHVAMSWARRSVSGAGRTAPRDRRATRQRAHRPGSALSYDQPQRASGSRRGAAMADVFVSYSRNDKARVAPLVASIEGQDWSVWWDPAISPGQEFDRQIAEELAKAAAVLVVWTEDSVRSRWVRGEARDGADRGILVPVRFGAASLPIDFRAFHTIDLSDGWDVGHSLAFQEIVRAIGVLVARSRANQPTGGDLPGISAAGPEGSSRAGAVPSGPARVGICVLPLANLGGDPEQQYFSDGIAGDIITELSRWRMLAVRSRSASFRYRGGLVDPMRVARDLDVRYVVEGSVRRLGDRVRISVQLIDGETGSQVWGEKFDRAQSELFAVQDQVVQTIAGTLVGRVQMTDAERARRKPPSSLAAYECVQRGNALPWDDPQAAAEAEKLFEQAIALDPGYAMAHALLGTMRVGRYRNDPADSTSALDEAYALTKRAVELDDGDSTCHSLLAHACLYRRSYELALQHMRRAVELNPNNAWNMADMGLVLTYAGPAEDALAWLRRAREVDPYFDPPWYWRQSGQAYMVLGRYEEALAMFAHVPLRTVRSSAYIAACHARLGHEDRAKQHAAECLAGNPLFSVRQFMSKEPFRNPGDSDRLAESLRMAGLPE